MRKTPERELEDLRAELAGAREKAARWAARAEELEEQVTEKENLLILRAVRGVAASPEELRELLERIRETNRLSNETENDTEAAWRETPTNETRAEEAPENEEELQNEE